MEKLSLKFKSVCFIGLILLFAAGCKEDVATEPSITTLAVADIRLNSVLCKGQITSDGGSAITARGFVWSDNNSDPTMADTFSVDGKGDGRFSKLLENLETDKNYFVKAYATNKIGTTYGKVVVFKTAEVEDVDGNAYRTVLIKGQEWMVDNLKTTKFNDGSDIPLVTDAEAWKALTTPGYCWTNNDEGKYKEPYGGLYNWYAVNTEKLCPEGWHVPSDSDWAILVANLGTDAKNPAGGQLKEVGTEHWLSPNTGATNTTGFTAVSGSARLNIGTFVPFGYFCYLWSSKFTSEGFANSLRLQYNDAYHLTETVSKKSGMYVRCLKDIPTPK